MTPVNYRLKKCQEESKENNFECNFKEVYLGFVFNVIVAACHFQNQTHFAAIEVTARSLFILPVRHIKWEQI